MTIPIRDPRLIADRLSRRAYLMQAGIQGVDQTLRRCTQYGERSEEAGRQCETLNATADELRGLCEAKVGACKSPEKVHILPELPKGQSGKIQRLYLNEILYGA